MIAIIFDLDNTLYDVEQYFSGAFKVISEYIAKKHKIDQEKIYNKLMELWKKKTSSYPYLFNDMLKFFDLEKELNRVVEMFNDYEGKFKPHYGVIPTLKKLKKRGYKLGIITDGNVERQKRKIKSLGIMDFFDIVILTKEVNSSKLSEIPFQKAINKLGVEAKNSFYVGDNPLIDFKCAKKTGMKTVRILKGEYRNIQESKYINYVINEITELLEIV